MQKNCSNLDYHRMREEYNIIKELIGEYKRLGGIVRPALAIPLAALDQAFITQDNIEAAFKSACIEMANFLATNEEYCAQYAGFTSKNEMEKQRKTRHEDISEKYEVCMAQNYYRMTQAQAVRKVLYTGDPNSFISVFTEKTRQQLWEIIKSWIGKRIK